MYKKGAAKNIKLKIATVVLVLTTIFITPTIVNASSKDAQVACNKSSPISWITCPILFLGSNISDLAYDFLTDQMVIEPELLGSKDSSDSSATRELWGKIRDLANIGFVIVFFVIIASHLTGYGLSNYHIKKMLPKIIVSAILINLSFFITQLMVDISNIVGSSIRDLFGNFAPNPPSMIGSAGEIMQTTGMGITSLVSTLLIANVAYNALPVMAFIFPVIAFVAVTIFVTIFILVARQAIVVFLAVLSPLAFLSIILPNTEAFFKAWKKILTGVLVAYPVLSLIFSGSELASQVLSQVANADRSNWMLDIMAKIIMVVPLVAAPSAIKNSIAAVPMVGSKLAGMANKLQSGSWKKARQSALSTIPEARHQTRKQLRRTGQHSGSRFDLAGRAAAAAHNVKNQYIPGLSVDAQDKLSQQVSGWAGSMTDQDARRLIDLGGQELSSEDLKDMSDNFRAEYQKNNGNMAMANIAAAEHLSKEGDLRDHQYQTLMQNAGKHRGFSNALANPATSRIFDNSKAAGAIDTAAYTNNIMQNGGDIRTGTASGPSADVARDYVKGLSSDELAKVRADSMTSGSAVQTAIRGLSSDPTVTDGNTTVGDIFQQRVKAAAKSGNMSAETHEAFSQNTGAL